MDHPSPIPDRLAFGETCGNRLALLDCRKAREPSLDALRELAAAVCEGPDPMDDLLVLCDAEAPESTARLFVVGADGNVADLCGNGLLYAAEILSSEVGGLECGEHLVLESVRGTHTVRRVADGWRADLGEPRALLRERDTLREALERDLDVIDTGEPHAVLRASLAGLSPLRDRSDDEITRASAGARAASTLTGTVNVTFVEDRDGEGLFVRTCERGVGRPTGSCGTGAAAAAWSVRKEALIAGGLVEVRSKGGLHHVEMERGRLHITARPTRWQRQSFSEVIRDQRVRERVGRAVRGLWPDAAHPASTLPVSTDACLSEQR